VKSTPTGTVRPRGSRAVATAFSHCLSPTGRRVLHRTLQADFVAAERVDGVVNADIAGLVCHEVNDLPFNGRTRGLRRREHRPAARQRFRISHASRNPSLASTRRAPAALPHLENGADRVGQLAANAVAGNQGDGVLAAVLGALRRRFPNRCHIYDQRPSGFAAST